MKKSLLRTAAYPRAGLAALLITASASSALAQTPFSASYAVPTDDRWLYPFNFAAGSETRASLFGAIRQPGFDDRDSDLVLAFNTSAEVTPGLNRLAYKLTRATLTIYVESDNTFRYDPTFDSVTSLYDPADPQYTADADPGRPLDVFPAGFRAGSAATWTESSAFGGTPIVPPAEGARNVFPAQLDSTLTPTDVSRQVRQRFEATPIAIATISVEGAPLTPGSLVPAGAACTFELIPTAAPAQLAYLQHSLAQGRLILVASSLAPASGGPGGGGDIVYGRFFTKENATAIALGFTPTLTLEGVITCPADLNGDNLVDDIDFVLFAQAYDNYTDPRADFNADGFTDDVDFVLFAQAYDLFTCP